MATPLLVFALICILDVCCCTLLQSSLSPFIVKLEALNSGSSPSSDTNLDDMGSVTIGQSNFSCRTPPPNATDDASGTVAVVERLLAMSSRCWELDDPSLPGTRLEVCAGVHVRRIGEFANGRMQKGEVVAKSDPLGDTRATARGLDEVFVGSPKNFTVKYECSDLGSQLPVAIETNPAMIEITIFTAAVCPNLHHSARMGLISAIPLLRSRSPDNFWEYQYKYPNHVAQVHIDITGNTKNESYSLGSRLEDTDAISQSTKRTLLHEEVSILPYLSIEVVDGTRCHKHGFNRKSRIIYMCPQDWVEMRFRSNPDWTEYKSHQGGIKQSFLAKILSVTESDHCEYEIVVGSTALCLDMTLTPREFEVPAQSIQCSLN